MAVALAILGCLLTVGGVALWSVPAALVVAGVECVAAAYIVRYLEAHR